MIIIQAKIKETPASLHESLKKATTSMLVLFLLRQKPMYIYEIMSSISKMSDGKISFCTLYALSNKLQKLGFIRVASKEVSEDNRIRVYLSITETGLDYLSDCIASYKDFNHDINEILSTDVLK